MMSSYRRSPWIARALFVFLWAGATSFTTLQAQDLRDVEGLVGRFFQDLEAKRPFKEVRSYFIAESDFEAMVAAIKRSPEITDKERARFTEPRRLNGFRRSFNRSVRRTRKAYTNLTRKMSSRDARVSLRFISRIRMEERYGMRRYIIWVRVERDVDNKTRVRKRRMEILHFAGKLKIMRVFSRL